MEQVPAMCHHRLVLIMNWNWILKEVTLHKKATIQQVTTMLATSKNALFPGHNHLPTTGDWWPGISIIARAPAQKNMSTELIEL